MRPCRSARKAPINPFYRLQAQAPACIARIRPRGVAARAEPLTVSNCQLDAPLAAGHGFGLATGSKSMKKLILAIAILAGLGAAGAAVYHSVTPAVAADCNNC